MKKKHDSEPIRYRIIYELLRDSNPKTLTEIRDNLDLSKELVYHHLKNLRRDLIVTEKNKKYLLQKFYYDDNIQDILNSQMKTIILTIFKELQGDYKNDELVKAVNNNLALFTYLFTLEVKVESKS